MKKINPIIIENINYYSFNQLIQLGLTQLEIEQYLYLDCKETILSGKITKLVKKEDYDCYVKFKNDNKKLFSNLRK